MSALPVAFRRFAGAYAEERERFADRRFWIVQALVLVLAGLHAFVEGYHELHEHASLYFVPEALFLLPVGYAALNFGLRGSVLTALWSTILALPHMWLWHRGPQLEGTLLQLIIVNAVALFVGQRVEREVRSRREAERTNRALQQSERRYRSLFETSAEAVLVFGRDGIVREANRAAATMLARPVNALPGASLDDLVGEAGARRLLEASPDGQGELVLSPSGGPPVYIQPLTTILSGGDGQTQIQALLRDMTQERSRREALRSYAGHILRAQEEERRRMAQELHDEVLQSLIILLRFLDAAGDLAGPEKPEATAKIEAARNATEDLVVTIRNFARQLRPTGLEDLGLVAAVRRVLTDVGARSPLRTELQVDGPERRLSREMELGLFRIVQEAVVNVERHAGATRLQVSLRYLPGVVEVQIDDNGRGLPVPYSRSRLAEIGSLGMIGMEERAGLLGGSLSVKSSPGSGTAITVAVPG